MSKNRFKKILTDGYSDIPSIKGNLSFYDENLNNYIAKFPREIIVAFNNCGYDILYLLNNDKNKSILKRIIRITNEFNYNDLFSIKNDVKKYTPLVNLFVGDTLKLDSTNKHILIC